MNIILPMDALSVAALAAILLWTGWRLLERRRHGPNA